jgi:hypothetical protein
MINKINNKNGIPDWFEISNYKILKNLDDIELENQLNLRVELLTCLIMSIEWEYNDRAQYNQILNKEIILTKHEDPELEEHAKNSKDKGGHYNNVPEHVMSNTESIRGYDSMCAYRFVRNLESKKLIKHDEESTYFKNELMLSSLSLLGRKHDIESLEGAAIYIDLEKHTDKELISDFTKLLPKWRSELKIKEPTNISYSKPSDIGKVVSYEIIPLMDLKIWCEITNSKITHSVYAGTLFPDLNRGENDLKQTILPFLDKLMSDNYRKLN